MARVELLMTGRTYFDDSNSDEGSQHAFGVLNARVGFEKGPWSVYLYGANLSDSRYYTLKIPPLSVGFPGDPRTFGLVARWAF